jgi:hypothetical protein
MDTFTARFSERVCQMVEDIDNAVAVKSLGTLTKMVKYVALLLTNMFMSVYGTVMQS